MKGFLVKNNSNDKGENLGYILGVKSGARALLRSPLSRWEEKKDNPIEVLHHGILALLIYQEAEIFKKSGIDLPIDINTLYDALLDAVGPRVKVKEKNYEIGMVVHLLWLFGCPRLQAIQAVADWYSYSETKVKNAHSRIKEEQWDKSSDLVVNLMSFSETISGFINETKKIPFPKRHGEYPKAQKAFDIIKVLFSENSNMASDDEGTKIRYMNIKKSVIELCPDIASRGHFAFD
jgi:hypothetical protein